MKIGSLTSPQVRARSDDSLARVISDGLGKMPAYKRKYDREQIWLLVAYIRELDKGH
jgi:mono/diheme cytochrome c family protein